MGLVNHITIAFTSLHGRVCSQRKNLANTANFLRIEETLESLEPIETLDMIYTGTGLSVGRQSLGMGTNGPSGVAVLASGSYHLSTRRVFLTLLYNIWPETCSSHLFPSRVAHLVTNNTALVHLITIQSFPLILNESCYLFSLPTKVFAVPYRCRVVVVGSLFFQVLVKRGSD